MAEWDDAIKFDLIRAAKSEIAVAEDRMAAINAESLATAGAAAKSRYGSFCTDLENAIQRVVNLRAELEAAGCEAASLGRLDTLISQGQAIATAKRAVYTANTFKVTLEAI